MTRIAHVLILASTSPALAQPASAESAVLFKEAQALMAQGRYAEACDAFDASQRLDPTPNTALNQANCREKNDQLATAWGEFLVVERSTRAASDDDGKRTHRVAAEHAGKLEARLSTLTVRVPDDVRIGGLEILRGTEAVDPALWGKAIPVDGGTYKVVARAPGNAEWATTITV
ncbi:MAG TPA: tetratricopeptide repeat protein, partial [Byssovorax sp.]